MSAPLEVLVQLLSQVQADALGGVGSNTWATASAALNAVFGSLPTLEQVDGRLVMPDEIAGEFGDPHLVVPLEISTDHDQTALAYAVMSTSLAAAALDSEADDPNDQEQQTIVVAATVLGQVIQGLNNQVFSASPAGLVLAMDDIVANTMPMLLAAMDEPALALEFTLVAGRPLPIKLILPAGFLDIMAGAMPAADPDQPVALAGGNLPFSLTAEDLDLAELIEDEILPEPEPAFAGVASGAAYAPSPSREPTLMAQTPAAQRAKFTPLPEPTRPAVRNNIDLLAGLQMNVTVELGRTELTVADVLGLGPGSVIELDRLAGEPVDILVNDRLIARGEVVVVDENFGVRVVEVVRRGETEERLS
jgi:flagellar motor switch protein FliN/FliY